MDQVSTDDRTAKRQEVIEKLLTSKKVLFSTRFRGFPMLRIKDVALVESLHQRGASVQWYDRTMFSTRFKHTKANMEAEVVLGPGFMS
jgi:hypothetical protein